jgi:hypothetical protein
MKTKTIIKSANSALSMHEASCMTLYEVLAPISEGVKGVLRVGDVIFSPPGGYTYVVGAIHREVARYEWCTPVLQSIKVRKFQVGDSFTVEFQSNDR